MTSRVLWCPDSYAQLKEDPDNSVDVILTDPPYSEHTQNNLCSGSLVGTKNVPKYELSFAPMTQWTWLHDAVRVARRWVLVFCALEDFGRIEDEMGRPTFVRSAVQFKPNSMGQLTADRPATAYEGIAILHNPKVKKRWNGRGSFAIWKCNGTRGKKRRHPNEKPVALAQKLVSLFSDRGETVYDPFCGSAAIGEACLSLGRNYIGRDQDVLWTVRSRLRLLKKVKMQDAVALQLCSMKG
jgi:site-specific DNA-methyltransferase (adenine-specific)